jgi:hypothetical protein
VPLRFENTFFTVIALEAAPRRAQRLLADQRAAFGLLSAPACERRHAELLADLAREPWSISLCLGTVERGPFGPAQRVWLPPSSICRQPF